jgi:hypothetical protein
MAAELRDRREMMVIMVRHEHRQIDQAHRGAESRMHRGTRKDRGIGRAKELYEFPAACSKLRQNIRELTSVVVRLVRASVGQIRQCELGLA